MGVSAFLEVRATAATLPTWSKNAFSPVTLSTSTADRNSEPICCDSIDTFAEN
jgi:hypothetical protein